MGTTSRGKPYPELTDRPDGAAQIRALAEATDADIARVEAAVIARVATSGGGLLGTKDPAQPLKIVGGNLTSTSNAQGIITIATGLTRYVGSFQVTQAGVSVSNYVHFIVRTDGGTPGQVQVFIGDSLGVGKPNLSVELNWLAMGQ